MDVSVVEGRDVPPSDLLADLEWDTDPELFSLGLRSEKATWRRLFAVEWVEPVGLHSRTQTVLAMLGARPIGLVNGFPGSEFAARAGATLGRYRRSLPADFARHMERCFETMGWLFPSVPQDVFYVLNLAVADEARGKGIGRLLMDHAEGTARGLGLAAIHLDTAAESPAVEFYRRIGFEALVETRVCGGPHGGALPSHFRMAKEM